ncbi:MULTISPECIES: DUF4397 domain-containing protein [Pedobacter]|uniref:DUF4397 domain-containing protein n=1 Tax=Pedobacter heparinus (strain ATCC 13125 / DSM 2366 / CIP 104194 / JCM 7457 / NBRC 12017 / NCIMB 9290 / NRRL B-14731 / HIM 762-3) TaxID=485917 RepID=C6XZF9_PEDHD|nr:MULTISPECIES: DUF4397 domain-containing protein [Pedobacter]ACU04655.1 hypothetical protein Phep_2451 [Pedobacter heparinus DSM 2366]MBB5437495.1 hypothetical protein [Pedobacter sp. AK017]
MNLFTKPLSLKFAKLTAFSIAAASTLLLNSCSKDPDPVQDVSFLAITNASPTLASYNVYIGANQANRSGALGFGSNVAYAQCAVGSNSVKFTTTSNTESVITKAVNVEANTANSLFLIGKAGQLDYLVLKDQLGSVSSDKTFIRFINLSPDAPALDLAVKDGNTLIADKAYKASSSFTEFEAKTYVLVVKDKATGTTLKRELASTEFKAGRSYTIIAAGLVAPANTEQAFTTQIITNQ